MNSGSAIKFDAAHKPYDIVSSGSIELARETHVLAVNGGVRMLGGNLTLKSDPLLPNPPAFIHLEGDLLVESGLVTVGDIPGRYVTFLTNNLTLKGDAILNMSVDGDNNNNHDTIQINTLSINPEWFLFDFAGLDIDIDGALGQGHGWDILTFVGNVGNDFDSFDFDGQNLQTQFIANSYFVLS